MSVNRFESNQHKKTSDRVHIRSQDQIFLDRLAKWYAPFLTPAQGERVHSQILPQLYPPTPEVPRLFPPDGRSSHAVLAVYIAELGRRIAIIYDEHRRQLVSPLSPDDYTVIGQGREALLALTTLFRAENYQGEVPPILLRGTQET